MEKIIIDLEAKTDKAVKGVEELKKTIEDLTEANKKAAEEQSKGQSKILKGTKALGKGFKGIGLAMKAAGFAIIMKIVDKLSDALMRNQEVADTVETIFTSVGIVFKQITDVLIDVFKNVSNATGGFDALQKVIGGSLSVAINAIVMSIQLMTLGVKKAQLAWEKSFLGDKDPATIKRLQGEIKEVGVKLEETSSKIKQSGKQIADNFVEAVGEVGTLAEGVVNGVSDAIDKIDVKSALSQAKRVVQNKKNYGLLESQSQRLVEQYDSEAESQRQIRDDDRKSVAERIKANDELLNVLNKQSKEEKKVIGVRIQALQEQVKLEGESNELTKELYDLNTELIAIDAKVKGFKSEQLTNEAALQKENIELTNSQKESESALSIERKRFNAEQIQDELTKQQALDDIDKLEQDKETLRLQAIVNNANAGTQAKIDAQIVLDEFTEQSRQTNLERDKQISDEKIKNALAEKEAKANIQKANLDLVSRGIGLLSQLGGKNKKLQAAGIIAENAVGVATQVINTQIANAKASVLLSNPLTAAAGAAAIVRNKISLGIGIASSVAATAKGLSALKQGGSGGGSAPSASKAPPSFNVVGASETSQLAESIGGQSQKPVKAFVVSNDVSTAQEMDRNIVEGASL